jgi:hypothetical protein
LHVDTGRYEEERRENKKETVWMDKRDWITFLHRIVLAENDAGRRHTQLRDYT